MHIKLLYRKVLYVFLSVMIVIANTQTAYSASPVGWGLSPSDIIIGAAGNTVTAIKGAGSSALQSTIKYAPTAANVGKKILKGGGVVAVAFAVTQLTGDSVDYVLDPANNRIKYTVHSVDDGSNTGYPASPNYIDFLDVRHYSITSACNAFAVYGGRAVTPNASIRGYWTCDYSNGDRAVAWPANNNPSYDPAFNPNSSVEKYLPINTVALKVQSNAAAGEPSSQELIKAVIVDDVNAGVLDTPFNIAAIPAADAPPVVDPVDPTAPVTPFDPSSIIAAIKSVMAAIANMTGILSAKLNDLMIDLDFKHEETKRVINDGMADVVAANNSTGARVGDVVAAIEAIEGNTLTGEVINEAIDRAIAEGKTNTADIVAAIEAIEGNTLDGQVINDAIDRVIANDNVNAQSAADAASAAADAASAADAANTAAVTDAIGAQTDAITTTDPATGEKSLKLPAFCGFAPVVCDYITWVKGEYSSVMEWVKAEPEVTPDDPIVVSDDPSGLGNIFQDKAEAGYVSFESACPSDVLIPIDLMGASQVLNISYTPFCHFASMIRYAVILGAWISGLLIVTGGRSRE